MGILAPGGPPAWHPAPPEVKAAGEEVVRLCEKRGIHSAAVALRFCLDHPYVSSTLVGMSSPTEVVQNLRAVDFRIPPDLMEHIEAVVALVRDRTWPSGRPENSDV
jgi:L-galactose dehydrogenase